MRRRLARILLVGIMTALFTPAADARIVLPPGFEAREVARGLGQPTNLAFDQAGGMWTTSGGNLTEPSDGVWYVREPGAEPRQVVSRLFTALGLTWHGGELFVASLIPYSDAARRHRGRVTAYSDFDGQRFERARVVLDGLPVGRHTVDSIVPGPDGRLYLGIGSEFDARSSRRRLSGTVVSFEPSGGRPRVEARGLRNPYGLAFVPGTSTLLVSENGRDDLGPFRPPDELNAFDVGVRPPFFGFPRCPGRRPGGCRGTRRPLAALAPHAAAGGVAVAERLGPYGLSAFVAQNGSSFRSNRTGSDVVRVVLRADGSRLRGRKRRFARGFRRFDPLGAAIGPDGALYVTLYRSSKVIRIAPREPVP